MVLPSIFVHVDGKLRAIGLREPGLLLQLLRHGAVPARPRVAKFVEFKQLRRERGAAIVSLAARRIDPHRRSSIDGSLATAIAKALGIGRVSVYRVLAVTQAADSAGAPAP